MMKNSHSIAIIGGGPAGISVCHQIVRSLGVVERGAVLIQVFEKSPNIGKGLPYSAREESYILNLPIDVMDISLDEDVNFSGWSYRAKCEKNVDMFPSRFCFGDYLEYRAKSLKRKALKLGITIEYIVDTNIINLKKTGSLFNVFSSSGVFEFDQVVLATGHMPSDKYLDLRGNSGYIHNPWCDDFYDNLQELEDVCIIGSRLTAIDSALRIKSKGHKGKIYMVSRSGFLPTVLSNSIPAYDLRHLTVENCRNLFLCGLLNMEKIKELFLADLEEAESEYPKEKSASYLFRKKPLEWINHCIYMAEEGSIPWQRVLFSLYPLIPEIWVMMSRESQEEFIDRYYSVFLTYLAAFPLKNAYKIKSLMDSFQLEICRGLSSISKVADGFLIKVTGKNIHTNLLVNGTGPGYDPKVLQLYRNLSDSGIVSVHPLGGIKVNLNSLNVMNCKGENVCGMFAAGELTKGSFLATTDMSQLNRQAFTIGENVALNVRENLFISNRDYELESV